MLILLDGQFVHVNGFARGLSPNKRTARSPQGTAYIFDEKGVWRVAERGIRAGEFEYPKPVAEELGPEWKRGTDPLTGLKGYLKQIKVPVLHAGAGVAVYTVQLERDRLEVGEFDDNRGFFVSWQKNGRIDIRRNKDGTPEWNAVRFPNARYLDLNGDGIFDVFVDFRQDREGEVFILLDQRFIRIKGSSSSVNETLRSAAAADGRRYAFETDSWRLAP